MTTIDHEGDLIKISLLCYYDIITESFSDYCCGASVASEQRHKQDLRRIYKREYDSRIHHFLPECIVPFYQNALRLLPECIAPFYQNALRLLPECIAPRTTGEVVTPLCFRPFSRGLQLIKVRYGLL